MHTDDVVGDVSRVASRVSSCTVSVREAPAFPDMTSQWVTFTSERCSCHRDELIATYHPMVRRIASKIYKRLPDHADLDDVVSYGTFGLIQAVDIYEPGRCGACGHMHHGPDPVIRYALAAYSGMLSGACRSIYCRCGKPPLHETDKPSRYRYVRFETVAAAHIRGRILDEFRSIDWAPRSVRRGQREVDDAVERLESRLGREPTVEEIAAYLTKQTETLVTPSEIRDRLHETDAARLRSLDEPITEDGQGLEVEDARASASFMSKSISEAAWFVLTSLSPNKRLMLALRYYEEMDIVDIATVMGIDLTKANKLHAEAVVSFRDVFAAHLNRAS